ncbi:DUF2235 domain-containing protein [uncultured Flavobacterium sp.]|uniref:phospholipase effector Tle1 domain-containing protein n=1 Tax=uncultured Flavobacterium sp. TaxID=165435 RepID=UPI0030EE5BCE|tara:strand:- start:68313 stop:70118 length:1806 start_codon:yes stop_codon:yes gene_type:complete
MGTTYVYNTGEDNSEDKFLQLEFGVFLDGTLNNRRNTEIRKKVYGLEGAEKATANEKKTYNEEGMERKASNLWLKKTDIDDNSYANDYSNVARMYNCCDSDTYGLYVEGIGTEDEKSDVDAGFMYGSGVTGVRGKVRKACEKLAKRIKSIKNTKGDTKLTKITIDVSGFSRGAAAARNFVYEINSKKPITPQNIRVQDGYYPVNPYSQSGMPQKKFKTVKGDSDGKEIDESLLIDGKTPRYGHLGYSLLEKDVLSKEELKELEICIRFIGIYDTVSSYEEFGDAKMPTLLIKGVRHLVTSYFNNDVEQLQLNNLGGFTKLVHFTAENEHRESFSLTKAPKYGFVVERKLPGVHCDIGGSYESGEETVSEIETSNHLPFHKLRKYKEELVKQHWFKDDQIELNGQFAKILTGGLAYRYITGKRNLKKEYSYIPLHYMEEFGSDYMKKYIKQSTETKYPLPDEEQVLKQSKSYLRDYVFEDGPSWEFKSDEELEAKKQAKELNEKIEKGLLVNDSYSPIVYDNLDPSNYRPNIPIENIQNNDLLLNNKQDESVGKGQMLKEVVVIGYSQQSLLRKLRNEYLHWSATRAGLGMDPNTNRKRREH